METNPSDQMENMETDLSPVEWLEKVMLILKEEGARLWYRLRDRSERYLNNSRDDYVLFSDYKDYQSCICDCNSDDDDENDTDYDDYIDDDDDFGSIDLNIYMKHDKNRKKLDSFEMCLIRLAPLFISQPQLGKICKDRSNKFIDSCFRSYIFSDNCRYSDNELHEKSNDIMYLIDLWGFNLTTLAIPNYPFSRIMPFIKNTCPNLEKFEFDIKEMKSKDFENIFSNMSHLKNLTIFWECENSVIPDTLINSLEQVSGTLIRLTLASVHDTNNFLLPDSLASVLPRLITLKYLRIAGFQLRQQIIQSVGEIKSLEELRLKWLKEYQMLDKNINMYPIGNLKNLEKLYIDINCGITDEFIINLCNNAKKLTSLSITGTNITDNGMRTLNNLRVKDTKTKMSLILMD